jgi:hypothetical protein
MHYIVLCTTCIALLLVSHTCALALDLTEHRPEEPQERAQSEEPNPEQEQEQEQGKPRWI